MMWCVGPCGAKTEIASAIAITGAMTTTSERLSKRYRNIQPAKTAAQNFAKFAASP